MENLDTKKEENINFLCKKYFTPELCDEPGSESKRTLESKIYFQMLKFGIDICNKNFSDCGDCEFIIADTISNCWMKWIKNHPNSYSAYFASAIKNNVLSFLESKKDELSQTIISLDEPIQNSENDLFLVNTIPDKNIDLQETNEILEDVEKYLNLVDIWYNLRVREDWNKTLITSELYDGLHAYFDYYPEKKISKFKFVDENIYNLSENLTNKKLAEILNKDEGQLSRKRKDFRNEMEDLFNKNYQFKIRE